jgi:dihydrofolate synthase/folylpolyglutamate synthase
VLRRDIERTGASFFEATTAVAFADFAARGADVAVVEVGLGGRLDATNILDPLVSCVITVGVEHTEYLGDSLESIAREKAGIAKVGRPFVIGERTPAVAAVLEHEARAAGAHVRMLPEDASYRGALGIPGPHQKRNAAVAVAVLEALPQGMAPLADDIAAGIAAAWLPGRFDRRGKWLFDVAHNTGAMTELAACLRLTALPRPVHAVVGMLLDKDAGTCLSILQPEIDALWVTVPPSAPAERRCDLTKPAQALGLHVTAELDFDRVLGLALAGAGTVLVTGSFHTVGDAMARLPGFAPLG